LEDLPIAPALAIRLISPWLPAVVSPKHSHEFQTLAEAGEDTIYIIDEQKREAVNKEVREEGKDGKRAIEVGNIFPLGTKFSETLGLNFKDENGDMKPVIMGSYGIGLGRLMGTVAEVLSDKQGLVWPKAVSPFDVHLLAVSKASFDTAEDIYKKLVSQGVEVLYDDRDLRAGEKFAEADLIGISKQVIIGEESLKSGELEVKDRVTQEIRKLAFDDLIKSFK